MTQRTNDHDLLIELKTQMAEVRKDIKSLGDNLVGRVGILEEHKISKTEAQKMVDDECKGIKNETNLMLANYKAEMERLGKIVYGACALVLIGFLGQLIALANG